MDMVRSKSTLQLDVMKESGVQRKMSENSFV